VRIPGLLPNRHVGEARVVMLFMYLLGHLGLRTIVGDKTYIVSLKRRQVIVVVGF
jgi:hypothetical protein